MRAGIAIRPLQPRDIESVAKLLEALARDYITPEFSLDGQQLFLSKNNEDSITGFVNEGFRYHVAHLNGQIVGFVGMRDNKHLYHLFVATVLQRQGLGRRLWEVARAECIAAGNPGEFTVNSSKNAIGVYERFGFVRTAPTQDSNGVLYNPMATLSGRGDR